MHGGGGGGGGGKEKCLSPRCQQMERSGRQPTILVNSYIFHYIYPSRSQNSFLGTTAELALRIFMV